MTDMTAQPTRGTLHRESFTANITPVDEKRFESEVRRIDAAAADEKKNREKFETRTEKAIGDLRGDLRNLRDDMNNRMDRLEGRMDKLDGRLWSLMAAIIASIIVQFALKYL